MGCEKPFCRQIINPAAPAIPAATATATATDAAPEAVAV